jgi:hypothetical protein
MPEDLPGLPGVDDVTLEDVFSDDVILEEDVILDDVTESLTENVTENVEPLAAYPALVHAGVFAGVFADVLAAPQSGPHTVAHTRAIHHDKVLAYGRGLSFEEFVQRSPRYARLLRTRLAETRLGPAVQMAAVGFPETMNILALVSEEDPDTIAVLPIVARLAAAGSHLALRILCDDEDLAPLATLAPELDLTTLLEEWDLPQFLCFDEDWFLQAQWGPRPARAEAQVEAWLAAHPEYEQLAEDETTEDETIEGHDRYMALVEELIYEMRAWYNSGLTRNCLDEWLELFRAWQAEDTPAGEGME